MGALANFPAFRLSDLSICWLSDLSGSWRGKPEALGSALLGLVSCRWCRQRVGGWVQVTALCSYCIVLSPLSAGGSRHGAGGVLANFPTFRLVSFPTFRLLDLLAYWFVGAGGGCVCVGTAKP